MRYAWQPAIQDAFEAAKAFEALSNGPRQKIFKASHRRQIPIGMNTNYCSVNQVVTAQRTYMYEMYEELAAFRQMGLGNPLTILWERLPWSFVIDWFTPVGTYLSLIGQVPFMKGRWSRTSSIRNATSGKYPMDRNVSALFNYDPSGPNPDADFVVFNLERVISFSAPSVPRPTLRVAGAVQGKRVGNAIALAHQVFLRAGSYPLDNGRGTKRPTDTIDALYGIASRIGGSPPKSWRY
jgi:hypothetical protein